MMPPQPKDKKKVTRTKDGGDSNMTEAASSAIDAVDNETQDSQATDILMSDAATPVEELDTQQEPRDEQNLLHDSNSTWEETQMLDSESQDFLPEVCLVMHLF